MSSSVVASDGTRLRAWRTGGPGPTVVISNGLGAPAEAWPGLVRAGSGFDVLGWDHRGLGGSARPADPDRIRVRDHADDLLAVMDAEGVERALLVGWSIGVGVAFELALSHPDRVAGILAVAGVPGGTFSALLGPTLLPRRLRAGTGRLLTRGLAHIGPVVRGAARVLTPAESEQVDGIGRSMYVRASAHALRAFAAHDWRWYAKLIHAAAEHEVLDLSNLTCPTTFLGGRFDLITDSEDVRRAAETVPGARYRELTGSHYLPLEFPAAVQQELVQLSRRAGYG